MDQVWRVMRDGGTMPLFQPPDGGQFKLLRELPA